MRFALPLLLCSCTMQVAPLSDPEALDAVSLAMQVYEHRYGTSEDFAMFDAALDPRELGRCDESDMHGDRAIMLDTEQIDGKKYPAAARFDTALHEVMHANRSCSDRDHGAVFVMEADSDDWHYHQVRDLLRRCDGELECLAEMMFSEVTK